MIVLKVASTCCPAGLEFYKLSWGHQLGTFGCNDCIAWAREKRLIPIMPLPLSYLSDWWLQLDVFFMIYMMIGRGWDEEGEIREKLCGAAEWPRGNVWALKKQTPQTREFRLLEILGKC